MVSRNYERVEIDAGIPDPRSAPYFRCGPPGMDLLRFRLVLAMAGLARRREAMVPFVDSGPGTARDAVSIEPASLLGAARTDRAG